MQALTPSGCGRLVDVTGRSLEEVADRITTAACESGTAIARGLALTRDDFREVARSAGSLAENRFGTGSSDLLDLNADPDPQKVVTGRAGLPLHADGVLVGTRPGIILLYAATYEEQEGYGGTVVCDQYSALADLDPALRRSLLEHDWEYWVEDESHFPSIARRWVRVPPLAEEESGRQALNLAMPFPNDSSTPGWRVRLPHLDESEAREQFARFDEFLRSPRYSYRHAWQVGDLLAIDNRAVLHGREAISPGGKRHLFRAQLR